MRAPVLALALVLTAGLTPASAQISGGVGSSNAANQSFQQQNSMRGMQQQQNFNNNQNQMRSQNNRMFNNTGTSGAYLRRGRR